MSANDLSAILALHVEWRTGDPAGKRADLSGANLHSANLTSTCLDPAALLSIIPDSNIEAAGLRIHGPWVYGWRTARSQHAGSTEYSVRDEPYEAPYFSVDSETSCHPGIYLAGKSYLAKEYDGHALVACKCLRSELVHAGDKWRCKRLWIVERHPAQAGGKGGE
jgi:hypothetical protein